MEPCALANCIVTETQKIPYFGPPATTSASKQFGASIGVSGDFAIVGQPGYSGAISAQGRAFMLAFADDAWSITQPLTASDPSGAELFGTAVAIDGDVAVIGAPNHSLPPAMGSASVFRFDGTSWVQEAQLLPSDGAAYDQFGSSVSVRGDVIAVGAPGDDHAGVNAGSAYVFRYDGAQWVQEQHLVPTPDAAGWKIGYSVSVDGPVVAAGSGAAQTGNAYVFRHDGSTWTQEAHFTGPAGQSGSSFGTAVAVNGDRLAIGAPNVPPHGVVRAYRYSAGSWGPAQELFGADPDVGAPNGHFGAAVAISGDRLAAGAPDQTYKLYPTDSLNTKAGAVGLFRDGGSSWIPYTTMHAFYVENNYNNNPNIMDGLGWSVALSGTRLVAGAPGDVQTSTPQVHGSFFHLDSDLPDCDGDGTPDACDPDCNNDLVSDLCEIETGAVGDCDNDGQPDECQAGFDYQKDDGTGSGSWGFPFSSTGGDLIWLNTFHVTPGNSFITHIAVAWVGFTPDDTPVRLLLYSDPTNDDDPHDAVLLTAVDAAPTSKFGLESNMHYSIHPVPRTYVGPPGSVFFVGALASCQAGVTVADDDGSATAGPPNWICSNYPGQADLANLSANFSLQTIADDFAVRAISLDCNGNGVADFCDISSGASLDLNGNGVPDECDMPCLADIMPLETGGNGSVDVDDLFAVINAWGRCLAAERCPADIAPSGSPPGDGIVNVDDLFAVINGWGPCP